MVTVVGSAQAAEPRPFRGTWTSVDTDGSNQRLELNGGGSGNYSVHYYDDAASVCGGAPAQLTGSGAAEGDDLFTQGTLTCAPGGNVFRSRLSTDYHLDQGTDTLLDSFGVVWHRS